MSEYIGLILMLAIYFFPTLLAARRSHNNGLAIFLLNLLLGWSIIGWIFALIWAATSNTRKRNHANA